MTADVLQQKKEELANIYINDLKKELGFLKGGIISMFSDKLKQMMVSDEIFGDTLDISKLNFWEKILVNMSPITAEKVFKFIKEKQEKLQKAKTKGELEILESGIVSPSSVIENQTVQNKPSDLTVQDKLNNTNSDLKQKDSKKDNGAVDNSDKKQNIGDAVVVGGGLGLSVYATDKIYRLQESKKIAKNIDLKNPEQFANKMKDQFLNLSKQLDEEAKFNPKLSSFQSRALSKSAKEFEKVAKDMDSGTLDAVKMLSELDRKLPASLLKTIDPKDADMFIKLGAKDLDDIIGIKKLTDIDDATKITKIDDILKAKGIKNVSKEVINVLKSADDIDELKSMVTVLTKSKGVRGFLKGIKGIAFLDLLSTGFDVWVLCEGLDEAESYRKLNALRADTKREHQRAQFGTSVALTAIGIIATCAAVGSVVPGLGNIVGAAVGVLGYAGSQAIDIYYDKVEFYLQNENDFKTQYRTEIKQAIIQCAAAEEWNLNYLTRLHASTKINLTTTEDARKALVWQEEYKNPQYNMIKQQYDSGKTLEEYKKTLSPEDLKEYDKQKEAIDIVINKRLEYIKLYMYQNKNTNEYKNFVSAMKNGMGIKMVEKILADSKIYYKMNLVGPDQYIVGSKDISDYKLKYETNLKMENSKDFVLFKDMREKTPYKFLEIYHGVVNFESGFNDNKTEVEKTKADIMQKNIELIKKFYEYITIGLPIEEQLKLEFSSRMADNKRIENMLSTGNFDYVNTYQKDNVERYFTHEQGILERMKTRVEVSDGVGQNIIYRIATEIHGYTGSNDIKELIGFFSQGKENSAGLYYDNKRIVNNDRAIDKGIDIDKFDNMTSEQILKERLSPNKWNVVWGLVIDPMPIPLKMAGISFFGLEDKASMIDTPTEGMDDNLNKEYWMRVKTIIYQEKSYSSIDTKKDIEKKIIDYISTNAKDGYIELPYYMIIAAKKAKIGDLQRYLFTYRDNKLVVCTSKVYLNDKLNFSQTNISREYISSSSENISENTQKYIDYVDVAKKQFENLISNDVDELDIPKEYLKIYQKKILDWEKIKQSLLNLDPETAKSQLQSSYQEYHDYFENTYISILSVISNFSVSNDLDSAIYHQQVEYIAARLGTIIIDKGIIKSEIIDQMKKNQRKIFDETILEQKIDGKNISDLIKSADVNENKKALWAVKQVLKSMFEAQVLIFNKNGDLDTILYGKNYVNLKIGLQDRLNKNIYNNTYFDSSKYDIDNIATGNDNVEIQQMDERKNETVNETNEVEKIIKETEPDNIYPGRGLVTFDPEKNILNSRGKLVKIDVKNLKIDGMSIQFFSLKELIMSANLVNWFKYKYSGVNNFYFGSRLGLGMNYGIYRRISFSPDVQILDLDTIKKRFPNILDNDNNVKPEFINYINAL